MARLPPQPAIDWSDPDAPRAVAFGDVYFSREGGLAESEAVFLAGCGLPGAWRDADRFAICELGFGSGLNVLAAWRAWRATRAPHAQLRIASIEAFPLCKDDAARALARFPEVGDLAAALLESWPVRAYAPQRFWFPQDGFALTVHVGDAEAVLAQMQGRFDAWFLDGFAPSRNPDMWSEAVCRHVARLSRPGARAASFSVAGGLRRSLEAAGFATEKRPGFGAKRERLEARLAAAGAGAQAPRPKRVAILGAGIAGASAAAALTRRNIETVVLDAAPQLGAGASGNPAGLIMPRLDRAGPLREVFLAAYLDAIATYERLGEDVFVRCGVEQRAEARNAEALADLLADPPLPADWFSRLPSGAAWHARGGVLKPQAAICALLRDAALMLEAPVAAIERAGEAWTLRAPDARAMLKADTVVLASGSALARFAPARFLPIELSRGQIEWGAGAAPHAIAQSAYLAPYEGGVLFGATFDAAALDAPVAPDEASRARNLAALARLAPDVAAATEAGGLMSRAALRAASKDRAPIAGALPDAEAWLAGKGERPFLPSVYVLGGLGARGLTLAPLLGETLASEMFDEPQALSRPALDAVHPSRFLSRALKRRT